MAPVVSSEYYHIVPSCSVLRSRPRANRRGLEHRAGGERRGGRSYENEGVFDLSLIGAREFSGDPEGDLGKTCRTVGNSWSRIDYMLGNATATAAFRGAVIIPTRRPNPC